MKHIDRMHARELKKGSAELLILSLVEVRARHGYEIGKLIEQRSSGAITFSAAALYPLLYRLEKRGWILGRWVEQAGQRRLHRALEQFRGGEPLFDVVIVSVAQKSVRFVSSTSRSMRPSSWMTRWMSERTWLAMSSVELLPLPATEPSPPSALAQTLASLGVIIAGAHVFVDAVDSSSSVMS